MHSCIDSSAKKIMTIGLWMLVLSAAHSPFAQTTTEQLYLNLQSDDFYSRLFAAYPLESGAEFDTSQAILIYLDALEGEVNKPMSTMKSPVDPFRTVSDNLKGAYIGTLAFLVSNDNRLIKERFNKATGEFRTRLKLVLARTGDTIFRDSLIELLEKSSDVNIRWEAIRALRTYNDTTNIPIFWKYIKDYGQVTEIEIPGYQKELSVIFPIRIEAACALTKFGHKFRRSGKYLENYELVKDD